MSTCRKFTFLQVKRKMMKVVGRRAVSWIRNIFEKYKELISYGFWGVMTTLVNYAVFFVCLRLFGINYLISNIISWVCAVACA